MLFSILFFIAAITNTIFAHCHFVAANHRLHHHEEQNKGEYVGYYFQYPNLLFITTESFVNPYFNKRFLINYLQQDLSSCIGGQGTLPYVQNTQQSPSLGFSNVLQFVQV